VKDARYRYIRYVNGDEELYDHASDPNEWTNLATSPEHAEIKAKLAARLLPESEQAPVPKKSKGGKNKTKKKGKAEA
jgi:hypothetical protein